MPAASHPIPIRVNPDEPLSVSRVAQGRCSAGGYVLGRNSPPICMDAGRRRYSGEVVFHGL